MKKVIIGNIIKWTFDDGVAPIEFDFDKMSEPNKKMAGPFGMGHRLGDMTAIPKNESNGFKITETMRRAEIEAGITHYENADCVEWNLKAGTRAASQNPTIIKIAAKLNISYIEAEAKLAEQFLAEMDE